MRLTCHLGLDIPEGCRCFGCSQSSRSSRHIFLEVMRADTGLGQPRITCAGESRASLSAANAVIVGNREDLSQGISSQNFCRRAS